MSKSRFASLLLFAFCSSASYAQFTDVINSNRPGESMSGFSVGKTVFQTEAGIYALAEDHDILNTKAKDLDWIWHCATELF